MKRLLLQLSLAALVVAPSLAHAEIQPAVCEKPGPGTCTEWRVYSAENRGETDEHAYFSWSKQEWLTALASCRAAAGTSVPTGSWFSRPTLNVTGGLCGRMFGIENLCLSRRAGDATAAHCVKWGSKPEPPKIPSADQRGLSRARSMG